MKQHFIGVDIKNLGSNFREENLIFKRFDIDEMPYFDWLHSKAFQPTVSLHRNLCCKQLFQIR
jgi:hypothetical protein